MKVSDNTQKIVNTKKPPTILSDQTPILRFQLLVVCFLRVFFFFVVERLIAISLVVCAAKLGNFSFLSPCQIHPFPLFLRLTKNRRPLAKAKKQTPLMQQYNTIKAKYPGALLLFRVGDFYETFGEDAVKAAGILGIVLTKRGNGTEAETALAGFPHHSL